MMAEDLPIITSAKRHNTSTASYCYLLSLLTVSALWLMLVFTRSHHESPVPSLARKLHKLPVSSPSQKLLGTPPSSPLMPAGVTFPSPRHSEIYFQHIDRMLRPHTLIRVVDRSYGGPRPASAPGSASERAAFRWMIDDYLTFHRRNRYNATRYLIYLPLRAGMGDRSDNLLFAYYLAVFSRRVFLVDWMHPFPLSDLLATGPARVNLFYDVHRDGPRGITARDTEERDSSSVGFLRAATDSGGPRDEKLLLSDVRTVVAKRNRQVRALSDEMLAFNKPDDVPLDMVYGLRLNYALRRAVMHRAFRLSDAVLQRRANLSRTLGLCAGALCADGRSGLGGEGNSGMAYIGVHARLGVGVGESMGRFGEISVQQLRAAKCLASRAVRLAVAEASAAGLSQALPVFLATDTPSFRAEFRVAVEEMSGGRVGVRSGDWVVVHSNRMTPIAFKEPVVRAPRLLEAMHGSYADVAMLAGARHVLALYSSFPRLALVLGEAETLTELRNEVCLLGDRWP